MILVFSSETIKGYRHYNPRNNTVITSRDVIIMENVENQEETVINLDYESDSKVNDSEDKSTTLESELLQFSDSVGKVWEKIQMTVIINQMKVLRAKI